MGRYSSNPRYALVSFRTTEERKQALEKHCADTSVSKSVVLDQLLDNFLKEKPKK